MSRKPPPTVWTTPIIARFRELAAGQLDMRACAEALSIEFGITLTRNACIGKSRRLGMSNQPVGRPRIEQPPKIEIDLPPPSKPGPDRRQKPRRSNTRGTLPRKKPSLPPPRGGIGKVLFEHLEPHHCRWPHGDGVPYTFCGQRKIESGSWYCVEHFNIASPGRIR
jgi:hypothetical protein